MAKIAYEIVRLNGCGPLYAEDTLAQHSSLDDARHDLGCHIGNLRLIEIYNGRRTVIDAAKR